MTLSDDKNDGLRVIRDDPESVLVPYRDNVTITCTSSGRQLRNTLTSGFRQCVYDPKPVCFELCIILYKVTHKNSMSPYIFTSFEIKIF